MQYAIHYITSQRPVGICIPTHIKRTCSHLPTTMHHNENGVTSQ